MVNVRLVAPCYGRKIAENQPSVGPFRHELIMWDRKEAKASNSR